MKVVFVCEEMVMLVSGPINMECIMSVHFCHVCIIFLWLGIMLQEELKLL